MDFKNRNKKHDAWTELGAELKTNSSEVEKKMRMLIGQFQRELKKGRSGDGADAPYKTKWIFFKCFFFKTKMSHDILLKVVYPPNKIHKMLVTTK